MLEKTLKRVLLKDLSHDDKRRMLVEHGIDILISDGRNLLCVFLISFFLRNTSQTLLYMFVLSTLRIHTGGWHASSELKCFITYQGMFLLFSLLNSFVIPKYVSIVLMAISVFYIIYFSPVEHKYNPLSYEEIQRNRKYCILLSAGYSVTFLFLIEYSYMHAQTIIITFIYNVILMELLRKSENFRYHDN